MAWEPRIDWDWDWFDWGSDGGGGGGGDTGLVDGFFEGLGTLTGYLLFYIGVPIGLLWLAGLGLQGIGNAIFGAARPAVAVSSPSSGGASGQGIRQASDLVEAIESTLPGMTDGNRSTEKPGAIVEAPQPVASPADDTFCLNHIQIARARYSVRWREAISREVYARCAAIIARQGGAGGDIAAPPSVTDRPAPEPGLTIAAAPLDLAPQERRAYCLKVVQLAKERFGLRWVQHVHPLRRRECRSELLEVVQIDRRLCQQMNCDLRQMPTERDVLRP